MTSTNRSTRPVGSISIPVEFVSESKSNRTSSSSSSTSSYRRFQPRQSAATAYERLIRNSQFNQPMRDSFPSRNFPSESNTFRRTYQRIYEPSASPSYFSRSNENLLDSKMDTTRTKEHLRRSFDVLNDISDGEQNFPIKQTKNSQSSNDLTNDQCDAQTDCSATRPSPSTSNHQQSDENKAGIDHSNLSTHTDQQVPSAEVEQDPNAIALEKLEQIQQSLANFNEQVDAYSGSTRNDRLYKGLDEQAVKLMMRCDELVNVNADIKEKRKEMIRNVQSTLAKLESKVPLTPSIEGNHKSNETNLFVFDQTTQVNSSSTLPSTVDQEQNPTNSVEKN